MRYAAITRPDREAPLQLVGVGETANDAFASALKWFDDAYVGVSGHNWEQVRRLQDQTQVYSEEELRQGAGIDLDAWLASLTATGQGPVAERPAEPPRGVRKLIGMLLSDDFAVPVVLAYDLGVILIPALIGSDGDLAAFAVSALWGLLGLALGLAGFRCFVGVLFNVELTWRDTIVYSFAYSTVMMLVQLTLGEVWLSFVAGLTGGV